MLGNIWLTSALIVTAIFSASAVYKSYSDIQEAKQIQEHYQIISDIKNLLAKQYNKDPNEITRDEIIAELPSGGNWEKVLLLDRSTSSTISNKELVNTDGDFVLNESEKIKLLALKAKLKNIIDISNISAVDSKYIFQVGNYERNKFEKDKVINNSVDLAIQYLSNELLYEDTVSTADITSKINSAITKYIPETSIYYDFRITPDEVIDDIELYNRKKAYFQNKVKENLYTSKDTIKTKLYNLIKEQL